MRLCNNAINADRKGLGLEGLEPFLQSTAVGSKLLAGTGPRIY